MPVKRNVAIRPPCTFSFFTMEPEMEGDNAIPDSELFETSEIE